MARLRRAPVFCSFALLLLLQMLLSLISALSPTYFVASPNVIRVGVNETVVIHIFGDIGDASIPVEVQMKDHPARAITYASQSVNVLKNTPEIVHLQVRPDVVVANSNSLIPQYVDLIVRSSSPDFSFSDETTILLSYKAGYVFLQTDKPVYTPNQEVLIRLTALDQRMRPSKDKIRLEIMIPHGTSVERYDNLDSSGGFISKSFKLPSSPPFGNWSAVAYYGHQLRHNSTIQFLVKEYVLPTFSVDVTTYPSRGHENTYILSSDTHITTLVKGEYVFQKPVQGSYRIRYSLLDPEGEMDLVKDGVKGTLNEHGKIIHTLQLSDILGSKDFDEFHGCKLHVEAFVVEGATGNVESKNNSILQFVESPFVFKWDQTQKYFKKDLAFDVKIDLLDHHGDPVGSTDVIVNATSDNGQVLQSNVTKKTNDNGRASFSINVPSNANEITVWMSTDAGGDLAGFQKTESFSVIAFVSNGNSDLLIQPLAQVQNEIQLDTNGLSVSLQLTDGNADDVLFLFVVAGGRILQPQVEEVIQGTTFNVDITHDMVPSARLVAFYVANDNRLIADSLWIDIVDQCENPIEINIPDNNGKTYFEPGQDVTLNLAAEHRTKVALLAVDSAVYLVQDYHRLTKKKMFAKMAAYDLGCGPGGGRDTADTFKNAGITVMTNSIYSSRSQKRDDLDCEPDGNRNKRAIAESLEELMQRYEGNDAQKTQCERGIRFVEGWSCLGRARALMNRTGLEFEDPVVQALYRCCLAMNQATARSSFGGNGAQPELTIDFTDVQVRRYFPQSWQFDVVDTGERNSITVNVPHSITTWVVQGVGVSQLHGMCIADNKEIVVRHDIFLDISLPYSVKLHEQVAIVATVYNYRSDEELQAELRMRSKDGLCCNARTDEFEEGRVVVPANGAKTHRFIVIPLEVKDFDIEIYMFSRPQDDAVHKILHVVPDGVKKRLSRSVILNPAGQVIQNASSVVDDSADSYLKHKDHYLNSADQIQHDSFSVTMPGDSIPGTSNCEMSVIGGLMGAVANASVEGLNAESLLRMPGGCPEQTMSSISPNVYVYKYVKSIDQLTPKIEENAPEHMRHGIAHAQQYINPDGSYASNAWLTAFALKVFCQASEFVYVDINIICNGIQWLTTQQNQDGSFQGSRWSYTPVQYTAFILAALSECNSCQNVNTAQLISSATMYLEGQLQSIQADSQSLAIVTYALAMVNSQTKENANNLLKSLAQEGQYGGKYFGPASANAKTVETTAYALLAQLALDEIDYSYHLVVWLTQQRTATGAWQSTQDTVLGLQALAQYAETVEKVNTNLNCDIASSKDQRFREKWHITTDNLLLLQSAIVPVDDEIQIDTSGVGIATLSVDLSYNTASTNESECSFEITINPKDKQPVEIPNAAENPDPKARMEIEVCVKYLDGESTNMAIIDVGLLSGFAPIKESLTKTTDSALIDMYEVTDRSVIFYADKVPGGDDVTPVCVTFEVQQDNQVNNVQPAPVKVYDYYLPDKHCVKFYSPENESPLLATICEGRACVCAASRCYSARNTTWTNPQLYVNKACLGTEYFAYDATLVQKEADSTFETYIFEITPLKNGLDETLETQSGLRRFLKNRHCPQPILEVGYRYLIIGRMDRKYSGEFSSYKYIIDGGMDIIDWPPLLKDCKNACAPSDNACKQKCNNSPWQNKKQRKFYRVILPMFASGCGQ